MTKRILNLLTTLVMAISLIGLLPSVSVWSANGNDLSNKAKSYVGRTGSSFGWTFNWCARFVWYCADQCGISSNVIPHTDSSTTMYNNLVNNLGGKIVSSPQAGDLAFYDYTLNDGKFDHVGIMTGSVSSVQGNMGSGNNRGSATVKSLSSSYASLVKPAGLVKKTVYIRPNYGGSSSSGSVSAPTFGTPYTTSVGEKSAYIKCSISKNGSNWSQVGAYYGTSTSSMIKAGSDNLGSGNTWAGYTLSNLKAGTTYYYKFYITANGTTYYSSIQSFKTKTNAPTFGTLQHSILNNAAYIECKINRNNFSLSQIGAYYGTSTSDMTKVNSEFLTDNDTWAACTLINLKFDTTYYYKFYVVANGTIYYSSIQSFKTPSHTHSYTSTVVAPTCTSQGYTLHECLCGDVYKDNYVDATGHNYKNGTCIVCGEKDPNPKQSSILVLLADNVGSQLGTQTLKITKDGQYTILADGLNCVAGDTAITISSKGARDVISGNSKITIDKILINGVSYSVPDAWSNASPWGYEGTVNDIDVSPWNPWWKNNSISLNDDTIINSIQITFTLNYTELIENTTDPHLMFSTRVVKLDLAGENSQTVNITAEGDLPNKFKIEFICSSQVQCKWGEWDGNKISLNIIGKSTGNNQVIINLYDLESYNLGKKEILYNSVINVTVQCSHKYEKQIVNPTCTEQGYTEYKCSICGEVYNDDYTYPTGHEYTSKVTREPTCLLDGIKEYNCTRCGNTYTETIEATGHNYEDGTCTECGEIDNGEILEYDDEGNLVNYSDGYGNIQRWSYYSDGSIKTEYFYSTDDDYWYQYTYDENGNGTYYEDSDGYWENHEYDENGNETYYENSDGYWENHEYDENDDQIYYEDSDGYSYTSTYKYTYYNNGDVKSRYSADSDNWWVETTYTYHTNGEVNTEYSEYSDGTWVKTTYDEYGAVLSEEDGTISDDPTNNPTANPSQNPTNAPTASPTTKFPTTKSTQTTTKLNNTATVTKPAKVKAVKLKAKKKKLNVKWKKVSGATGYEVMYAKNNKFTKGKKTVTVKKNNVTLKRLKSKKKYFVKVRAYKKVNGNTFYGNWSKVVKKKTK